MANEQEDKAIRMGQLIARRMTGRLLPNEDRELEAWLAESDENRQLYTDLLTGSDRFEYVRELERIDDRAEFQHIREHYHQRNRQQPSWKRWLPYAAAVLLVASVVGWWAISDRQSAVSLATTDILPGGNRATLTLADGRTINLDEAQTGITVTDEDITYNDGSSVGAVMVSGAELSRWGQEQGAEGPIKPSLQNSRDPSVMLALTTPKGGTYQVTLPDGSKVWLNSASTLKYPSRFSGDSREVILEGEAYFDIRPMQGTRDTRAPAKIGARASSETIAGARVSRVPFKVQTSGQTVEVLGTQFNISAYPDDPETKTTLVEGSVRLSLAPAFSGAPLVPDKQLVLVPGEQGVSAGKSLVKQQIDVEQYSSWKNGYFKLDGSLASIMAQVSRWYDVEVVFADGVDKSMELAGQVSRSAKLSDLLWMINEIDGGLKFKVEQQNTETNRERRLTIMR